jgi:hypothetical protein
MAADPSSAMPVANLTRQILKESISDEWRIRNDIMENITAELIITKIPESSFF